MDEKRSAYPAKLVHDQPSSKKGRGAPVPGTLINRSDVGNFEENRENMKQFNSMLNYEPHMYTAGNQKDGAYLGISRLPDGMRHQSDDMRRGASGDSGSGGYAAMSGAHIVEPTSYAIYPNNFNKNVQSSPNQNHVGSHPRPASVPRHSRHGQGGIKYPVMVNNDIYSADEVHKRHVDFRTSAMEGVRVAELIRQPYSRVDDMKFTKTQHMNGHETQAAGIHVNWGMPETPRHKRLNWPVSSDQIRDSLQWTAPAVAIKARQPRVLNQRHLSSKLHNILHNVPEPPTNTSLNIFTRNGLYVDSALNSKSKDHMRRFLRPHAQANFREVIEHVHPVEPDELLKKGRSKSVNALRAGTSEIRDVINNRFGSGDNVRNEKLERLRALIFEKQNPCRWGVDVFNYPLPPSRRPIDKFYHPTNLDYTLVPKITERDQLANKKIGLAGLKHYNHCLGTSSLLVEVKNLEFKRDQKKKYDSSNKSSLDSTCTPVRENQFVPSLRKPPDAFKASSLQPNFVPMLCERWPTRRNPLGGQSQLMGDFTPMALPSSKTIRKLCMGRRRDGLQLGNLHPLPN